MNILVTGAGGQLGKALRQISDLSGHRCFFTDIRPEGVVVALDITDADAVGRVLDESAIDIVVNCAAYTDVERAEAEEDNAHRINAYATGVIAGEVARRNISLIHVSTDYVFDGQSNTPYDEHAEPAPLSVYGRTKLEGEKLIEKSGCRHLILRTAWLYSSGSRNFFNTIVEKTASLPQMKVVVDQVGTPTYAADLARAIFHIIGKWTAGQSGVYNYTCLGVCSWYDFAVAIRNAVGHICEIKPCLSAEFPTKARRPHYSVLDKSRIMRDFGLDIPHWTESLRMCVMDYESLIR
jgi:dTDP-4-dehydrorhamnose reductase